MKGIGFFGEFLGGIFLEEFFGRNFFGGFFWEDFFWEDFFWKIFGSNSTKSYLNMEGIDLFVKILG